MARFHYVAQLPSGARREGVVESDSLISVMEDLRSRKWLVVDAGPVEETACRPQADAMPGSDSRRRLLVLLLVLLVGNAWVWVASESFGLGWISRQSRASATPSHRAGTGRQHSAGGSEDCSSVGLSGGAASIGEVAAEVADPAETAYDGECAIDCTDCARHIGQTVWVRGEVCSSFCLNGVTYLHFGWGPQSFVARIESGGWCPEGTPPHRHYRDCRLRVRGMLEMDRQHPCIRIRSEDQILRLGRRIPAVAPTTARDETEAE